MDPRLANPTLVPPSASSASLARTTQAQSPSPSPHAQPYHNTNESTSSVNHYSNNSHNNQAPSSARLPPPPPSHPGMGQSASHRPQSNPQESTGGKLKRAFAGRRKNSQDGVGFLSQVQHLVKKGRERTISSASPPASLLSNSSSNRTGNAGHSAKQLGLQLASSTKQVFAGKRAGGTDSPLSPSVSRPPPPPKPVTLQAPKIAPQPGGSPYMHSNLSVAASSTASFATSATSPAPTAASMSMSASQTSLSTQASSKPQQPPPVVTALGDKRGSVMPHSPSMDPALHFMRRGDQLALALASTPESPPENRSEEGAAQKADWRKSDATMMGYPTARPGATGSRASRPVSMADSVNSTSTVMPVNRRLSALVTESEYATVEEETSQPEDSFSRNPRPAKGSPAPSVKANNRRSQSLTLGPTWANKFKSSAAADSSTSWDQPVVISPSPSTDAPALSRTAAAGIIAPSHTGDGSSPLSGGLRGRLAAWTTGAAMSSGAIPRKKSDNLAPPPTHPGRDLNVRQPVGNSAAGYAATGFAALGKKVGRAWNARAGSPTSFQSSGSTPPSAYGSDDALGRIHSNNSGGLSSSLAGKGKGRRTPNAPSGSWSITSSTTSSTSDSDQFDSSPTGPFLGKRLRPPLASGGLVFGRSLTTCVEHTRSPASSERIQGDLDFEVLGAEVFGHRMLPALVRRCAEHLMKWGVGSEEEGLFRISGRSTHVNRIRAEFDGGADYDLVLCTPADLDPHAVASVLKAYLRELPEPILTTALASLFESAMATETETNAAAADAENRGAKAARGPGLPTGPRAGGVMPMRKPPSLTTLAAPSFAGMKAPSRSLVDALSNLIARLPAENKDLLRTIMDLIKETAKKSRVTKMPLSNLLLVFCPSLHMSPPLVRVLCEAHTIWGGSSKPPLSPIIDIKPDDLSKVIDISPPVSARSREHTIASLVATQESAPPIELPTSISRDASITSDDDSNLSASVTSDSSRGTRPDTASNRFAPSSSSESLGPSTPSEGQQPSTHVISLDSPEKPVTPILLQISTSSDAPLYMARSPSGSIAFPMTSPPNAVTPISPKKSFPSLSLPSPPSPITEPSSPKSASPRAMRMKRPSLTLLFSGKKSNSSLSSGIPAISSPQLLDSSPFPSPAWPASARTLSTPPMTQPPKLDTIISSSPIQLSLDPASPSSSNTPGTAKPFGQFQFGQHLTVNPMWAAGLGSSAPIDLARSTSANSDGSSGSYASAQSTVEGPSFLRERPSRRNSSMRSGYDPLRVELGDDDEAPEEWTKSVLLAADVAPDFTSLSSVRDAIKAYEGRSN